MSQEQINEILSHIPDVSELKELAKKQLMEYLAKNKKPCS